MSKSIRISDEAYAFFKRMAAEQRRSLSDQVDWQLFHYRDAVSLKSKKEDRL